MDDPANPLPKDLAWRGQKRAAVVRFKNALGIWIRLRTAQGEEATVTVALLEMAIDRHIDMLGEAAALECLQQSFRGAVQRRAAGNG